jgi:hypothetical protein
MSRPHIFIGLNHGTFVPGKEVTGVVVLVVQEPLMAQAVKIHWYDFVFECMGTFGARRMSKAGNF